MYFEYRIVKIEKGIFIIEYKTAPFGVWHEVKNKQFKTKPKAEAWARKNLEMEVQVWKIIVNIATKGIAHCKVSYAVLMRTILAS